MQTIRKTEASYRFEGIACPASERETGYEQLLILMARVRAAGIRLSVEDNRLCWWANALPSLALLSELEAARATIIDAFRLAGQAKHWQWGDGT